MLSVISVRQKPFQFGELIVCERERVPLKIIFFTQILWGTRDNLRISPRIEMRKLAWIFDRDNNSDDNTHFHFLNRCTSYLMNNACTAISFLLFQYKKMKWNSFWSRIHWVSELSGGFFKRKNKVAAEKGSFEGSSPWGILAHTQFHLSRSAFT